MRDFPIILPFRGEFGLKIRYHVPAVYALKSGIVCIEPGEEALYPRAKDFIIVEKNDDDRRRHSYAVDKDYLEILQTNLKLKYPNSLFIETHRGMPEERFIPKPTINLGLKSDVVVCPRWRKYGATKNWMYWSQLTEQLNIAGISVLAAGSSDASINVPAPKLWEYPRALDACIEAILNTRLVIATDSGLAHLAILCGTPLLLISHGEGLVAPGPVLDENGVIEREEYWGIRFDEYYKSSNHTGTKITIVQHGWYELDRVFQAIREQLL